MHKKVCKPNLYYDVMIILYDYIMTSTIFLEFYKTKI